jgi:hypothetical protein
MTRIRERRCTTSRLLQALVLFLRAVPPALSPRAHREALTPSLKNRTMSGSTAETTADTIAETTAETTAGTTAEITTITRALRPRIPPMRVSGGGTQIFPARNHQSRGPTRSQPEATKRSVQLLEVTGRNVTPTGITIVDSSPPPESSKIIAATTRDVTLGTPWT